jgi:hypothetical protein
MVPRRQHMTARIYSRINITVIEYHLLAPFKTRYSPAFKINEDNYSRYNR